MNYFALCISLICTISLAACMGTDSAQESAEANQIVLEEVLRLGDESAGDTILFGSIRRIAVNGRGDILVNAERNSQVHAFKADGTYLGPVGTQGEGPGEYQYSISGPVIGAADSVYLWESWPRQILTYDPEDFSYVRSVEVEDAGLKQIRFLIGAVENGWVMAMGLPGFLEADDGSMTINEDDHHELIKVNLDGSHNMDLMGTVPAREIIYNIQENGGLNFVNMPFARSPVWTVGYDDMLYYGWNETIEITAVSADGVTRKTISYEHVPVPITDAEMDEARDTDSPLFRQLLSAYEHHETKPSFQTFTVDDAGRIWLKLSGPEHATEAEWLILSGESQLVSKVELPVSVDLEKIRGNYAYGIQQEDGEAPMVVVYEIQEG